ncbi:MAG: GH36-type glycosyl hydrolase domain-containing protein [Candidatus Izemoplasmataceae bacterium]
MEKKMKISEDGSFVVEGVDQLSYTYFPMCNPYGMKSSISPNLGGDMTIDQNHFLLVPSVALDLRDSFYKRSVYVRVNNDFTWATSGLTASQTLSPDKVTMSGSFLIHQVTRKNKYFTCDIESFVPVKDRHQELHKVTFKNTSDQQLTLKPVIGIPVYGRSADSVRDHRHVTSLLNKVEMMKYGVINQPTFSFDERGHIKNTTLYGVFSKCLNKEEIVGYYPTMDEFVGEGHTLYDPLVVKEDTKSHYQVGDIVSGYEAMAGLAYDEMTLAVGESFTLLLTLEISEDKETMLKHAEDLTLAYYERLKEETKAYWEKELFNLRFHLPKAEESGWLKWVSLQPTFRRIYGNSFMPHHDYGRGGKGWRDLWQDLLALIIMNPTNVRTLLLNNFKGVRIDGSNATIIGDQPGEFLADRNNIARVWMDHGSWPLLTTKLYLDQSGDLDLLFENVTYFHDQFTHYTKQVLEEVDKDYLLKTKDGDIYEGTILEHLLVQNLVPYYNVGDQNNIRLEDADWNDGLDMASERGESVAFTAFYGQNLISLADILEKLSTLGHQEIDVYEEFLMLLKDVAQSDVVTKQNMLKEYFDAVSQSVGKTVKVNVLELKHILSLKGQALLNQVRNHEFLETDDDGWFNGYYDNDGHQLDNVIDKDMTLTGQVFAIMSEAASNKQIKQVIKSADTYLFDESVGGYRLNTDFKEVKTNMGRLFGFAYGHKENGAMFSHMAVMYANALYKRGFVRAGYKVLHAIYQHSMKLDVAKIYPGIPEYFDQRGRGMYHYLTGSASWMVLTYVTEVFGVKGSFGDMLFEPKLLKEQFHESGKAMIDCLVQGQKMRVVYNNKHLLDFGEYKIKGVKLDGRLLDYQETTYGIKINEELKGQELIIDLEQ